MNDEGRYCILSIKKKSNLQWDSNYDPLGLGARMDSTTEHPEKSFKFFLKNIFAELLPFFYCLYWRLSAHTETKKKEDK